MPRGDDSAVNRQQMETFDYPQPDAAAVAVQRTEKGFGRHQPEGADRQSAFDGSGRYREPQSLSGSAAARGVFFEHAGTEYAADYQSHGRLGHQLPEDVR